MKRTVAVLAIGMVGMFFGVGCSTSHDDGLGVASAAITQVPKGVECVQIEVQGARTVQEYFDLAAGQSSVIGLSGLPSGEDTFTAFAYDTPCKQVTSTSSASWLSDSVTVDLEPGVAAPVTLKLHPTAGANVGIDFDSDGGAPLPATDGGLDGGVPDMAPPTGPAPSGVTIGQASYAGSGCPAGSVAQALSPDAQVLTVLFSSFEASAGPNAAPTDARKDCQLTAPIHVPQGWSVAVASVDFRGYVQLDQNVKGTEETSYRFGQSSGEGTANNYFYGALDQDYTVSHDYPLNTLVWSSCGAADNLVIDTSVKVDNSANPTGSGLLTVDSADAAVKEIYHLAWKQCP